MAQSELRTLFIVNKLLPENDYRLAYGRDSAICDVVFGLPEKPKSVPDHHYVRLGFEEGLHPGVFRALLDLYFYLRKNRREVRFVHLFTTLPILLGSQICLLAGVPSVITMTGFGRVITSNERKFTRLQSVYKFLLDRALKVARRVLFQNQVDLEQLSGQYPELISKFSYVGSTTAMAPIFEKDFFQGKLKVFLGTRLMPDKGIDDFIEVARKLSGDEFQFILSGPKSRGFTDLYDRVLAAGRDGTINFVGELDTAEMEAMLAKTHVMLFPSYGEGLARLMLEAGAAQMCPVAYNIPANRDLVINGGGFLVNPGDLSELVRILAELQTDRVRLAKEAKTYQEHILANYGSVQFVRALDYIFSAMAQEIALT